MRITDLLHISCRQVWRQYRKNIGVAVAITLGTAGLMVIITMGQSIEKNIGGNLEIIGNATQMRVSFKPLPSGSHLFDNREFRPETIQAIKNIPGVEAVSGIVIRMQFVKLVHQENTQFLRLIGVDDSMWQVHGSSAQAGTLFSDDDIRKRRPVCVLGQRVAQTLFGDQDGIGQFLSINDNLLKVVGVLDALSMPDKYKDLFIPLTTAQDRFDLISPVNRLYLRCHTWEDVEKVAVAATELLKKYQPYDEVEIIRFKELLAKIRAISLGVKIFVQLALIATLLLGGFGIWNIMMMAVTARTKEIGLKKAIGAEDHDILLQFLTESLVLCLSAAIIGFLVGWLGIRIAASILETSPPQHLFWLSTISAFIFCFFLGIVAGLAPAIKASKMEVVSALSYE